MTRLKARYQSEVMSSLKEKFGYANVMAIPRLEKIVVNVGLGEAITNPKLLDSATDELGTITGQKPIINRSRKAIASFKLRKGVAIGCSVTLRSDRMYEFFDRLISVAIPRVRDFRGLSGRSFDGRGNFSMGVSEQIIFPEIDYDQVDTIRGLDITITTTARNDEEGRALLKAFSFPLRA